MSKKTVRQSNIELLRIISMLLIISFHYVYKSGYVFETLNLNSFIVKVFYLFGELGVNIFFLITGYFMIDGKFSFRKLIHLLLEIEFYHLISMAIALNLGIHSIYRKRDWFLLFFPTILNDYWFVTVYVLVYLFSPYFNILIQNLKKKDYQKLLFILLTVFCIIPTFFGFFYNTSETLLNYSRLIWAIVIYFVGAYLKKYPIKYYDTIPKSILWGSLSFLLMVLAIPIIYYFRDIFSKIGTEEVAYFWTPNNILMLITSVSLFEVFLKIKIKPNRMINKIASTTLGIYILHDGKLNTYMWSLLKTKEHLQGEHLILYILLSSIIIFISFAIVDFTRQGIDTICRKLIQKWKEKKNSTALST